MARTKKKEQGGGEAGRACFMLPRLHEAVAAEVRADGIRARFHAGGGDSDATQSYSTHIMGTFTCRRCSGGQRTWSSKMVAILIRGYGRHAYNAVVFNQRCRGCNGLGVFSADRAAYVERVAYRLRKWAGLVRGEAVGSARKSGPPHERSLCEGCKRGHCREGGS